MNAMTAIPIPPPRISVVIVTYQRQDALSDSLQSAVEQDYDNKEIIVVDNNSGDGTADWVRTHFPAVYVVELDHNGGPCRGRNAGIRSSTGRIIVTMDDDILFDSPSELRKIAAVFGSHTTIDVIACQLLDAATREIRDREWCHPRSRKRFGDIEFETNYFVEGACASRREVFERVGTYWESLFIGCEGHELAMRMLNAGYRITYCPSIRMRHLMVRNAARNLERPFYFYTRNYIWITYKIYPLLDGLRFLLPKLVMMMAFSIRAACLRAYLKGLREGIFSLKKIHKERRPVHPSTVKYYYELDKLRPGILARLTRHRNATQI